LISNLFRTDYSNQLTLSIPDEDYSNQLTLSVPDERYLEPVDFKPIKMTKTGE
jgi:hypothetical protein